ncbi:hypothetical protein BV898_02242 [Hypsibius exemplaris]|uniref:Uncharacterized protein n=1 Tax=Hypsibius exemplaris TaxID=2072580 RepID=A0A1W0X8R8_HYPEX|nr:hypothetical protein BV898_02242 [Hypsibius exemplaris]
MSGTLSSPADAVSTSSVSSTRLGQALAVEADACGSSSGVYTRRDTEKTNSAGVPAMREPADLCRADGWNDDNSLLAWQGKGLVCVANVSGTVAVSHFISSTTEAVCAAREAEDKKHRAYAKLEGRYLFVPLAFQSFGTWTLKARD